ncbi:hypothetical protein R9C00_27855 [Flammeovirgaceae bacterium SG7u.111]|nr:hypothetical protein [Flammeovirgaceae bacterium SG7u.132]WPO38802.1 hypothetical protein R9C00_27855 [Flammeovirgaceae bacterium SG7u.111]
MIKSELELEQKWEVLQAKVSREMGVKTPDLNAILFIIGVHELGKGPMTYTKEEKQDLLHIAICKVLSLSGYYELEGVDEEGWPHWKLVKKLPFFDLLSQEKLLKIHVIEYFETEIGF